MEDFACLKCGKKFKMEHHLKQHNNRKSPCIIAADDVNNPLRCIHCKRIYSTKPNLLKHSRKCKMKNGGVEAIPDPNVRMAEQLRIMNEEREKERDAQKQEREKLISEMAELRAMMKEMMLHPPVGNGAVSAVNNGTNNIGVQNNIVINNYNTPSVDHLLEFETFRKMFSRADIDLPVEVALNIYFDPSHPENESVHLIDKETKRVLAKVDGKWNTFTMEKIVAELRDIGYKYAAEGIKKHLLDDSYPDRRAYMMSKSNSITQIKQQKVNPKSREYEEGMIEEKIIDEFVASSQHPAVIADKERRKQLIADAKRGEIM